MYCNSSIHYTESQQTHAFNFKICFTRIHLTVINKLKIPDLATPKVRMEIIQRKTRYPVHLHLQKYRSYIYIFQVTCWFSGIKFQSCIVDPPWSSPVGSWPIYLVLWQHPLPCQGLVIELLLWWPPGASLLPPKHFSLDPRYRINLKNISKNISFKEKILSELAYETYYMYMTIEIMKSYIGQVLH